MHAFDMISFGKELGMKFVPFLFALCFHEFAHGWVARLRGDRTAEMEGRLSMNPMAHADPIGTWMLPLTAIAFGSPFFFGWAKPVPVNARNLRRPKYDMFWVSVAGPASNVLLALVATVALGLVYGLMPGSDLVPALTELLKNFVVINLFLACFNLIPVHPLDGGKVIEPFIPRTWNRWLEDNQGTLNIALMIFIFTAGGILAAPVLWAGSHLLYLSVIISHALA